MKILPLALFVLALAAPVYAEDKPASGGNPEIQAQKQEYRKERKADRAAFKEKQHEKRKAHREKVKEMRHKAKAARREKKAAAETAPVPAAQ